MKNRKFHSQFKDFGSMKILLSENLSKRQSGALSFTNVRLYIRPSVQKMFIKDFTASTRQNDLIFGIKLPHHELYRVSAFQICEPSTSCLPISESGGIHVPWTHFVFILHRQSVFINWLILSLFYIDNRSSSIDFCIDWCDFNKTLSIGLLFIFVTLHACTIHMQRL